MLCITQSNKLAFQKKIAPPPASPATSIRPELPTSPPYLDLAQIAVYLEHAIQTAKDIHVAAHITKIYVAPAGHTSAEVDVAGDVTKSDIAGSGHVPTDVDIAGDVLAREAGGGSAEAAGDFEACELDVIGAVREVALPEVRRAVSAVRVPGAS